MRARHSVLTIVLGLLLGWTAATTGACTAEPDMAICVKIERSCTEATECEVDEDCVPADAFGAEAITFCDEGSCVWDCSDGESCPGGWRCQVPQRSFDELIGGC